MDGLRAGRWAVCFGALAVAACTETAPRQEGAAALRPDLMEALPPEARHVFSPPDASWEKKVSKDSLAALMNVLGTKHPTAVRIEQYFDSLSAQPRKERDHPD